MTPEQLREAAAVMLAAADGKKIEGRWRGATAWEEKRGFNNWSFDSIEYRIKPELRKVKVQLYKHPNSGDDLHAFVGPATIQGRYKPVSDIVEIEVKDE